MIRTAAIFLLCAGVALGAPDSKRGSRQPVQASACNDVPPHAFDLIPGRPTRDAITLSVLVHQDTEGRIAYGPQPDQLTRQTPPRQFRKGEPVELVLGGLQPDTRYYYQFRSPGASSAIATFHTQRPPGGPFTFTLTADSHLDGHTSPAVYLQTLANARDDAPDFHIDLGDTFMTEKHASREDAARQYLAQRYYFGSLATPLFLVLGNHDGESPRGRGGDDLAVWSNQMRKSYFPNPVPDGFFTGDATQQPAAGLLQDYYAWEWGDALFVALDPFWFTQQQHGQRDNWKRTLGEEQYRWLQRTLEGSKARFKFVFIHHLVGGLDEQCRGGAEAAPFWEWGGRNTDGTDGFGRNRPGWAMPIHQLFVRNHVSAVFHGHDHLYARQELDGIVYQEVPQPGDPKAGTRSAAEYGYRNGTILAGSGYVRVAVAPDRAVVEYVRTVSGRPVADRYIVQPR